MAEQEKTFKVRCAHCQRTFHVRFSLARPDVAASGDVMVRCLYCTKDVMVTIPQQYIEEDVLVRGLKSRLSES